MNGLLCDFEVQKKKKSMRHHRHLAKPQSQVSTCPALPFAVLAKDKTIATKLRRTKRAMEELENEQGNVHTLFQPD